MPRRISKYRSRNRSQHRRKSQPKHRGHRPMRLLNRLQPLNDLPVSHLTKLQLYNLTMNMMMRINPIQSTDQHVGMRAAPPSEIIDVARRQGVFHRLIRFPVAKMIGLLCGVIYDSGHKFIFANVKEHTTPRKTTNDES